MSNKPHHPASGLRPEASGLSALIERLEKATGPDRELDADIARLLGYRILTTLRVFGRQQMCTEEAWNTPGSSTLDLPHYTSSLDAALTLVPEGGAIRIQNYREVNYSDLRLPTKDFSAAFVWVEIDTSRFGRFGATLAIALCIAALKARASIEATTPAAHGTDSSKPRS